MKAKQVAQFGLLTALALVLGWIERFIPVSAAAPGIKLGLGNTVLLYAIYMMDAKSSLLLMVLKVFITGFFLSNIGGMLYSLAGGLLSLGTMLLTKKILGPRLPGAGVVIVSVVGAVFHNVGQLAVAYFTILARAVMIYAPTLLIAGFIMGILTGVIATFTLRALKYIEKKPAKENTNGKA